MNSRVRHYEISLIHHSETLSASVETAVRDWTEGGRRHRPCSVALTWSDGQIEATASSVYHAFQQVREHLEARGLMAQCQGSRPDVQVSGMLCDMSDGTFAYDMAKAAPGSPPPTVEIFAPAAPEQLGTVSEQRAYMRQLVGRGPAA